MKELKILIVDDEKEILDIIAKKLVANGYQVFMSTRGRDAVQQAIDHLPDLILIDIVLPDIDGAEVVKILQSNLSTKNIYILFLSGIVTKEGEGPPEIKVGNRLYPAIAKPFTEKELLGEIKKIIG